MLLRVLNHPKSFLLGSALCWACSAGRETRRKRTQTQSGKSGPGLSSQPYETRVKRTQTQSGKILPCLIVFRQLRRLPPMRKTTQKIPPRGLPSTRPRTKQQSQPPIHDPNGRFLPFPKFSMKTNENRTQTQSGKTFRSCFLRLLQLRLLPAIAKTFFIPQRGATKHNQAKDSLGHSSLGSPPHFRTVEGWASPF